MPQLIVCTCYVMGRGLNPPSKPQIYKSKSQNPKCKPENLNLNPKTLNLNPKTQPKRILIPVKGLEWVYVKVDSSS